MRDSLLVHMLHMSGLDMQTGMEGERRRNRHRRAVSGAGGAGPHPAAGPQHALRRPMGACSTQVLTRTLAIGRRRLAVVALQGVEVGSRRSHLQQERAAAVHTLMAGCA